jgi:CheY-like chemotaxis protein
MVSGVCSPYSTRMSRLLVIEDYAPLRQMLQQAFEQYGYAVDGAGDGHKGLDLYRHGQPPRSLQSAAAPNRQRKRVTAFSYRADLQAVGLGARALLPPSSGNLSVFISARSLPVPSLVQFCYADHRLNP